MKRIVLLAALGLAFTAPAGADPGLTATAVCNGKWVAVTVDAPDTAVIVATYGGKTVAVGNKFVPDTGGGHPAGDYDITIVLEQWDTTAADHKVLASGSVRTPNCAPVAPTTTAPVESTPVVLAPPTTTQQVVAPVAAYDVWTHIVEAMIAEP